MKGDKPPLSEIVETIASEQGVEVWIADQFRSLNVDVINQTNESDLTFLTRLAKQYDAICKPGGGVLAFGGRCTRPSATFAINTKGRMPQGIVIAMVVPLCLNIFQLLYGLVWSIPLPTGCAVECLLPFLILISWAWQLQGV